MLSISIIIPCLNEEKNIGKCIDSIKNQKYSGELEVIAVDNDSVDDTAKIIKEKGVILAYAENSGPAATKNAGVKLAKGDIIVFIDADCIAHSEWLTNMIMPFSDSSVGCVAGEIFSFEPKTEIEKFLIQKKHLSQSVNISHPFLPYAATANAAYRKEVFEHIGLFDESLLIGEDADMSWRMQLDTNYKLRYLYQAAVYHPHETRIKTLFKQKQRHAYGAVALYKKYRRFWPEQHKSLKKIYWEYSSIIKRLLKFYKEYFNKNTSLNESHFQTILEAGWKFGLLKGSMRYRVWYV